LPRAEWFVIGHRGARQRPAVAVALPESLGRPELEQVGTGGAGSPAAVGASITLDAHATAVVAC
jgi:hypothetical protein